MSARWAVRLAVAAVVAAVSLSVVDGQGFGRGRGGGRGAPPRDLAGAPVALGTGVISGSVVLEGGATPVRRARVTLTGAELRGGRSVMTDDLGRFTFQALPAGRFTMTASKPGFVAGAYGAKRPGRPGTPIQLADGQKIESAVISLPRGSVITGIVVDEHGDPAPGTQVRALRFVMRTGDRTLQMAGQDQTDDRGMYRIYQLEPGDYIVNALPRNMATGDLRQTLASELAAVMQQARNLSGQNGGAPDLAGLTSLAAGRGPQVLDRVAQLQEQLTQAEQAQPSAYAPVYYPGTTSASAASTIALGVGEEHQGVDFQLLLVPTARVDGTVVSPDGTLPQGVQVALVPADNGGLPTLGLGFGGSMTRVGANGHFEFTDVTPGQYQVEARAAIREAAAAGAAQQPGTGRGRGAFGPISQVLWASNSVAVGGQDVSNLVLSLQPGLTVAGRVEFDGTATPPDDLSRVRVLLRPRGTQTFEIGGTPPGQADVSGRFSIAGVAPGRYTFSASVLPEGAGRGGRAFGLGRGGGAPGQASSQWSLVSAMVDGRDALDFPVDIGPSQNVNAMLTFSDRTQELSGTIQDPSGRPTSDFTIVLFPSDRRYWLPQARRIASSRPSTDGRFTFDSIPAGDYRLTAVTDAEPGEWYDPAFLSQLVPASIPISLAEGDKKTQNIRVAGN